MIDGEIIAHVAVALDPATHQAVTTTWHPPEVSATPEGIAEMMRIDLPAIVAESLPQEFECSAWGRKALKAGKYLWRGVVAAAELTCCAGSLGVGCIVCTGVNVVVDTYITDKLDNHCD